MRGVRGSQRRIAVLLMFALLCVWATAAQAFEVEEERVVSASGLIGDTDALVCQLVEDGDGTAYVCSLRMGGQLSRRLIVRLNRENRLITMGYALYRDNELESGVVYHSDGSAFRLHGNQQVPIEQGRSVELVPGGIGLGGIRLYQALVDADAVLMLTVYGDGSFQLYNKLEETTLSYANGDKFYTESGDGGTYRCYGDGTAVVME